jgi:hypothetical protein
VIGTDMRWTFPSIVRVFLFMHSRSFIR